MLAAADLLLQKSDEVMTANGADVERAEADGVSPAVVDRLRLSEARLGAMADGLHQVAALADPVGEVTGGWVRPNGLRIEQIRVPLGVVAIIYENRPNVTSDAAGLCLKVGQRRLLAGQFGGPGVQPGHRRRPSGGLRKGRVARGLARHGGGHEL